MAPLWGSKPKSVDPKVVPQQSIDPLPPVKAGVKVSFPEVDANEMFTSRIVLRDDTFDYLDALRTESGVLVGQWFARGSNARMWWGSGGYFLVYPIHIHEVLSPIPALAVLYRGQPRTHNRRREARANAHLRAKFTSSQKGGPPPGCISVTRNISFSGVRFFSPAALDAETIIEISVDADGQWFTNTAKVLHSQVSEKPFRQVFGYDVVGLWDPPLTDTAQVAQWKALLYAHRFD